MQQQFHSYAFQLQEGCISTDIHSHPKQPIFYTSAVHNSQPESIMYCLKYSEQNPRKSQLTRHNLKNRITAIYPLKQQQPSNMVLNLQNSLALLPYKFDTNVEDSLNVVYKSENKIKKFMKKNQKQGIVCTQNCLSLIDMDGYGQKKQLVKLQNEKIGFCSIDPIHQFVTYTVKNEIFVFDKNCEKQKYSFKFSSNELQDIRGIDYNPNKQFYLMTSHLDYLKFWDIRKSNMPIKCIDDHHSLVLSSQYNHSHDELLITSYDDGTVALHRVTSISSSSSSATEREDAIVNLYDEHEDSVYKAQWSGFSPWIFASVSYGAANLVINTVSEAQKFRILL